MFGTLPKRKWKKNLELDSIQPGCQVSLLQQGIGIGKQIVEQRLAIINNTVLGELAELDILKRRLHMLFKTNAGALSSLLQWPQALGKDF